MSRFTRFSAEVSKSVLESVICLGVLVFAGWAFVAHTLVTLSAIAVVKLIVWLLLLWEDTPDDNHIR